MKSPEFDEDGYPTEATLKAIRIWSQKKSYVELLMFVKEAWHWPDYATSEEIGDKYRFELSTGGWSGNEELIGAMQKNTVFWTTCWVESRRGGHYKFEVRKDW